MVDVVGVVVNWDVVDMVGVVNGVRVVGVVRGKTKRTNIRFLQKQTPAFSIATLVFCDKRRHYTIQTKTYIEIVRIVKVFPSPARLTARSLSHYEEKVLIIAMGLWPFVGHQQTSDSHPKDDNGCKACV